MNWAENPEGQPPQELAPLSWGCPFPSSPFRLQEEDNLQQLSLLETLTCFRESWFSGSEGAESEWKKALKRRRRKRTPHFIKSHNPRGSVKSPPSEEDFIRWSSAGTRAQATETPRSLDRGDAGGSGQGPGRAPHGKGEGAPFS